MLMAVAFGVCVVLCSSLLGPLMCHISEPGLLSLSLSGLKRRNSFLLRLMIVSCCLYFYYLTFAAPTAIILF